MSTARSAFTEAIEEHLALKKQNTGLESAMPLARYDVGDPLDRYPGGPNRAADGTVVVAEQVDAPAFDVDPVAAADATQVLVGPSPEQAMEAATALEPAFGERPFEPLAPMLSLVEDIDEDQESMEMPVVGGEPAAGEVLRFPGGVGPRQDEAAPAFNVEEPQLPMETHSFTMTDQPQGAATDVAGTEDAPTGEQPVLVIDSDEPLATTSWDEPVEPTRPARRSKPRFFGLGRKKEGKSEQADGWFTDGPRDFNWD